METPKAATGSEHARYRFGEFELDTGSYTLTRAGRPLPLTPKVFDVLRHLIEHRGRVVTKEELLDTLWSDAQVSEVAVPWAVSHARRALGQRGRTKQPIETVHRRGYRFVAEVDIVDAADGERQTTPRSTAAPPLRPKPPLVGRDRAMNLLRTRLLEAGAGSGGICTLAGAAGIGKTRCLQELASAARAEGFAVWLGRSTGDTVAPVFWPWMQVLDELARDRPTLRQQAQALLGRLRDTDRSDEAEPAGTKPVGRFWLFDGVMSLLREAVHQGPILLLFDDLHWADDGTIQLLSFLARELSHKPMLVVTAQREGRSKRRTRELRRLWRHAERIELEPLTPLDIGQYLGAIAGKPEPQVELSEALHRATAGNPLFLSQTVRALISQHGTEALVSLAPELIKPVKSAREILRSALDELDGRARRVLEVASVLGEEFDSTTLQALCQLEASKVLAALESAREEGFITAEQPNRFRFCHALLRSALYDELATLDCATLHRRAAEVLERSPTGPRRLTEIAHHHYRSLALGDCARVVTSAEKAARAAARVNAFSDAVTFCRWALEAQDLDPHAEPRARAKLLLLCAHFENRAGDGKQAQQTIALFDEMARKHGYADLLVRAARLLRPTHLLGGYTDPRVCAMLEEALRLAPQSERRVRVSALSQLSWIPPYALDMERSKELSARALSLARELNDNGGLLEALHARLYALSGPDDMDALVQVADELLHSDRVSQTWISMEALMAGYGASIYRSDLAEADAKLAALGRIAREQKWLEASWGHDRIAAQRRLLEGDFAGAEAAFATLYSRAQHRGIKYGMSIIDMLRAVLTEKRDGPLVAARGWDALARLASIHDVMASVRPGLARMCLGSTQRPAAKSVLETMVDETGIKVPKDIGYLNALANLALLAIDFQDRERAELLYEELASYPGHNTPTCMMTYEGSVSHFLGVLAVFLQRSKRAAGHFDDALAMNDNLGLRPQLAQTCYEYARLVRTSARGPQRKKGQELLARAIALADNLGMGWLGALARALD